MPSYIVKVAPDRDEYVWWSDIVEAPKAVGTREEVAAVIREWGKPGDADPARFDRADRTGCSALWPSLTEPIYAFTSNGPIAEQRGFVPRDKIGEYARLRCADDPAAFDLLEPFDDA
jgi:hypothetical protein